MNPIKPDLHTDTPLVTPKSKKRVTSAENAPSPSVESIPLHTAPKTRIKTAVQVGKKTKPLREKAKNLRSSGTTVIAKKLKSLKAAIKGEPTPKQVAKHEEKKELRRRTKTELATTKETLKIKKTALRELEAELLGLASQHKGLSRLDKLRNFAHEKFALGKRIQSDRDQFLSTPNQVVTLLSLEGERRTLTGEIKKIQHDVAGLKFQISKKSTIQQSATYWGEKIIRGLSRREELGRSAQVQDHTIPGNPVVVVQILLDAYDAISSIKNTISIKTLENHVRSLEKMGAGRLQQINDQLHSRALERQTQKFYQDPAHMVVTLSQHPDIRAGLLKEDDPLSTNLSNAQKGSIPAIHSVLQDPTVVRILSQGKDELDRMEEEGECQKLFEEKEILIKNMRPVMEARAQLASKKEKRMLKVNLYKVGISFHDLIQTTIGIAQLVTMAEPTKICAILVGALKAVVVIPTFPLDVAIIRSNLKDATHSLSNLSAMRESFRLEKTEKDPQQAIGGRIKELERTKNFELKYEMEQKKEEIKLLDKAWELQKSGKLKELNKLTSSANLNKETEYLLKPELKIIDQWIGGADDADLENALTTLRELVADSDVETAKECIKLSHPNTNFHHLFQQLASISKTNDLSLMLKDRYVQLTIEVNHLNEQLKNNDPTDEIIDLQQAAKALEQNNMPVLMELFEGKREDGKTPLLSLKSQQAVRPHLKAVDDRLQEFAERQDIAKSDGEIATLMQIRRQIITQGKPNPATVAKLSPDNQAAIKTDSFENEMPSEAKAVLNKGKTLFLDSLAPYMKQRLRMKRITEWTLVASDLLIIAATIASVAGFALLVTTGVGAIPVFAAVVLLLVASAATSFGGAFFVDAILKGQKRRRQFLEAVERGEIKKPKNWKEKIDQGLRHIGLKGNLMDKRDFFPAIFTQIEDELKNWDTIKANDQVEKTLTFTMYHLIRDYLPEKLPVHVDPKRYAEMLTSNEGNAREVFYHAINDGMLHHDLSRLTPRKMIQIANRS